MTLRSRYGLIAICLLALAVAGARIALLSSTLVYGPVDYGVYRGVGSYLFEGANVYAENIVGEYVPQGLPFVYTPFAAILLTPLSWLPEPLGLGVWTFLNALALGFILASSLRYVRPNLAIKSYLLWFTVLFTGSLVSNVVAQHLIFGQINLILVALCLADMTRPPSRYLPRGVLLGIAAGIKLTPALFILFFVLTARWKPALVASATGLVTLVVSAVFLPATTFNYFSSRLLELETVVDLGENFATSGNSSLQGISERLFETHSLFLLAPLLVGVLIATFWLADRFIKTDDFLAATALIGVATCLLSPVSWLHHWTWAFMEIAVLARHRGAGRVCALVWVLVCLSHLTDLGDLASVAGWPPVLVELMRASMVICALSALALLVGKTVQKKKSVDLTS
ncbi:glycosyltransferase 87 family protein [Rothia sp. P5764]|uniref:glycosyltransferase 87 family protein n=1 Tax=Rothia sp. P5764 TaxID=3402654 RepID=UPI003AD162A8